MDINHPWLRRFSKLVAFSTLFLIFAGSMVTSTGSGLAVPDWPLSYGMVFPPMVGGVFYEHGHRMIAATVGFLTLIQAIWLAVVEKRRWVRNLGFAALGAVIAQGVLGGITVLLMLPDAISISHAVLSQTFFIITIILAYSLSIERSERQDSGIGGLAKASIVMMVFVYLQLILGALMRHTNSGLAIPDFPTVGGNVVPVFNDMVLKTINAWRFQMNLEPVHMNQVLIHFSHRLNALFVLAALGIVNFQAIKLRVQNSRILRTIFFLNLLLLFQLVLGAYTVWSAKQPLIASLHVVTGASILGISALLVLRTLPLHLGKNQYASRLS